MNIDSTILSPENVKAKIAECFRKEATSYSNLIQISGKFLIHHNLVESWAYLRNINPKDITDKWVDHITTIIPVTSFGLAGFCYPEG